MQDVWLTRDKDGAYSLHTLRPSINAGAWTSGTRAPLLAEAVEGLFGCIPHGMRYKIVHKAVIKDDQPVENIKQCPACGLSPDSLGVKEMNLVEKSIDCPRYGLRGPCATPPKHIARWNRLSFSH